MRLICIGDVALDEQRDVLEKWQRPLAHLHVAQRTWIGLRGMTSWLSNRSTSFAKV